MEKLDFYRCNICGNIVQVLNNGAGELVCCGKPMTKMEPQLEEESMQEKHVPVFIKYENNQGEIRVGEILHPMTKEHYIMFIQAISKDKSETHLKFLYPEMEPKLFLNDIDNYSSAFEYCNIHGLWEKIMNIS